MDANPKSPLQEGRSSAFHAASCSGSLAMMLPGFDERSYNKNDVVLTPPPIAADIVRHFKPSGAILDPCKGEGAFLDHMPGAEWCELREGVDFFAWSKRVDWIVSNPPYSIFTEWLERSMKIADDIVYLIPLSKVFNSEARLRDIMKWGGIVETRHYGSGTDCGFPFGFPCGAVHIRRGYKGPMRWSFYCQNVLDQIPRTQDVADTTDSPERLSASFCSPLVSPVAPE